MTDEIDKKIEEMAVNVIEALSNKQDIENDIIEHELSAIRRSQLNGSKYDKGIEEIRTMCELIRTNRLLREKPTQIIKNENTMVSDDELLNILGSAETK